MAEIEFEPLVSSPDTQGTADASMPRLFSFGAETLDVGLAVIPLLIGLSAGTYNAVENIFGVGSARMPSIKSHATNYTTGIYVTTEGYGYGYLPLLSSSGYDTALIAPSSGSASASVPALSSSASGSIGLRGTSAAALPKIQAFGIEAAGAWAIGVLPGLTGGASQSAAAIVNYVSAMGHQGVTNIFVANDFFATAAETVTTTDTILGFDLPNLISRVNMTGSVLTVGTLRNSLTESVSFNDALSVAWAVLIAESVQLAGDVAENKILICALIDSLHAVGAVETRMDAVAAATSALVMESMIQNGWSTAVADSAAFTDAFENTARLLTTLVDSALMAGSAEMSMRMLAIHADTIDLTGVTMANMIARADLADDVMMYMNINIGGGEFAGWVLNTDSKAASEYKNYPFESLVMFGSALICAGAGGIYESGGDNDDGTNIDAYIRTGLMDFGNGKYKRVPDVYIGKKGSGELVMKVITTSGTGTKVEDWYIAEPDPRGAEAREGRFKLGKGVESVYHQFVVHNKAGGDLELSKVALRPVTLSRRT